MSQAAGPGRHAPHMTAHDFNIHREFLVGVAYRMLGSLAEAEDIVQDAYLRWSGVTTAAISNPRAHLAKIVSRLCLDRMKSAAVRREEYVGTWLPEPLVQSPTSASVDDISVALLLTLERLTPLERAAFLLHDVFDMDYPELADTLGRSEAACRQLAARARERVRSDRPRFSPTPESTARLAEAFASALRKGRLEELTGLLADDAVVYTDGGGKRRAPLHPIYGKEKVLRFFEGTVRKGFFGPEVHMERVLINGLPGFILRSAQGEPETMALEVADDRVVAVYAIRNPDKLRHLAP